MYKQVSFLTRDLKCVWIHGFNEEHIPYLNPTLFGSIVYGIPRDPIYACCISSRPQSLEALPNSLKNNPGIDLKLNTLGENLKLCFGISLSDYDLRLIFDFTCNDKGKQLEHYRHLETDGKFSGRWPDLLLMLPFKLQSNKVVNDSFSRVSYEDDSQDIRVLVFNSHDEGLVHELYVGELTMLKRMFTGKVAIIQQGKPLTLQERTRFGG